jgi:hypothetical protein
MLTLFDRLARSLPDTHDIVNELASRRVNVNFRGLRCTPYRTMVSRLPWPAGNVAPRRICGTDAAAASLSPNVIGGDHHHPTRCKDCDVDVIYFSDLTPWPNADDLLDALGTWPPVLAGRRFLWLGFRSRCHVQRRELAVGPYRRIRGSRPSHSTWDCPRMSHIRYVHNPLMHHPTLINRGQRPASTPLKPPESRQLSAIWLVDDDVQPQCGGRWSRSHWSCESWSGSSPHAASVSSRVCSSLERVVAT